MVEWFPTTELGARLVGYRNELGITQAELAKRLGVHFSQVSRWEKKNYKGVAVERIQEVIDALGIKAKHKIVMRKNK